MLRWILERLEIHVLWLHLRCTLIVVGISLVRLLLQMVFTDLELVYTMRGKRWLLPRHLDCQGCGFSLSLRRWASSNVRRGAIDFNVLTCGLRCVICLAPGGES